MQDLDQLEREHNAMVEDRRPEEPAWRDIARIVSPDEQDFDPNETTDRDDYDVFDSTPLMSLDEFAGGMFGENVNPAERWMELGVPADPELAKWGPVKKFLWDEASLLFNSMAPAVSQFYSEATAWFSNLGRYGNSFLYQEEWLGRQMLIDKAIAAGQAYIRLDPADRLEAFNRTWKWSGRQIKTYYGKDYDCKDDDKYQLICSVYPNPDHRPGQLGPRGQLFASTTWSPDLKKKFRYDRGYYEMPFHEVGWNKRAGKTYKTGPGHVARPDMNTLNEMERANLVDAQFAAEPLILTAKEGVFTAADIYPNNILEGSLNDDGKKQVDVLQRGDNPLRAENKTEQVRNRVREAFRFSMMHVINRPQMTAQEYLGWKEEKYRSLGPQLVRVQQGLASFIARRYRILARAGQTTPIPPELARHNISVEFVSPLAKAQKLATGRGVVQWIGQLGMLAEAAQDPSIMDIVNKDGASRVLHDAFVGTPDVINDQKTVADIRRARAAQQEQTAGLERAAQGAAIIADVAHASQAMSSAKSRARPN